MNCKKTDCNKCSPKTRYCGELLECLDVKKGDAFDGIVKKINDLLCNEFSGTTYIFEDNDLCGNGGIIISEVVDEIPTVVYEACFSCCENELSQYIIDAKGDIPVFAGDVPVWINILGASYVNEPEFEITTGGNYKIILEERIGGEDNSRYLIGIGLNGNPPAYSPYSESNSNVTVDIITTASYFKKTHVYTCRPQANDEVSIWVKVLVGGINLDTDLRMTFEKM